MAFRWSSESVVADHKDLQANTMAIDHSGQFVVLAGRRNVAIVDTEKPHEVLKKISRTHQKYDVTAADWNPTPHMDHIFALAVGEKAEIWHWKEGMLSNETTLKAHSRAISDLHWHRLEPNFLATCSIDTFLYIWDVRETRRPVISLSAIAGSSRVKWNPLNSNYLASGHDSDMRIWDRRKSNQPLCYINAHLQKIHGLDWSPSNENKIVSSSSDSTVKFFDITNPRTSDMQISLQSPVWRARYTPFGEGIMTVTVAPLRRGDNSLLLWSLSDVSNPVHTFVGHTDVVLEFDWRIVDASMSEVQLVTWSKDNSLRIWRLDPQILKMCGHSFDEDDVAEAVEIESSDTDTLLGSASCQDETAQEEMSEFEARMMVDDSPVNGSPRLISSLLNDRMRREPPKTLALNQVNTNEDVSQSPDAARTPSLKLTDSSVSTPSLPPTTPSGGGFSSTVLSVAAELAALNLHFEKTPETSVEIIKKEDQKQCLVNVTHANHLTSLEITLPPNYPKTQSPGFRICSRSTIDSTSKKELLKVLKTAATQDLKKKRNCLEHCIKIFVTQLKALLTEERSNNLESGSLINNNYFPPPPIYGGQQDYSIPFPRTSGARFGSSGILVCFTRPNHRQSCPRSARAEPSTPRSLSALNAYMYQQLPNNSSSNNKYNNFYSSQNSSIDKSVSISMYYNQDNVRNMKHKRGKSGDVEYQKSCKTGMITIYDISKFIPISREMASEYFLEADKIGSCHKNLDLALSHNRRDIAQAWSMAATILSLKPEYGADGGHPWAIHPYARKLSTSLINDYLMKHDVQTAAMLSCILGSRPAVIKSQLTKRGRDPPSSTGGSPYNTIHGTNTETWDVTSIIRHNRSNSEGSLSEASRPIAENSLITKDNSSRDQKIQLGFLDPRKAAEYDNMRKAYSEILYRWDLLEKKALVDKYRINIPPLDKGIDFQIECLHCYQSSPTPQCVNCKHLGFNCSLCQLSVRGSSIVCMICGHGGHTLHLIDWFADNKKCPTGCGCECIVEMEQLFCKD